MKKNILIYCYSLKRLEDLILFSKSISFKLSIIFIIYEKSYIPLLKANNMNYIYGYDYGKPIKIFEKNYIRKFLVNTRSNSIGQYINEKIYFYQCSYYTKISKLIMHDNNIDLFISITDRHSIDKEVGLFKASSDLNIPIFLLYLANWNPEANYLMIKNSPKYTITAKSSNYQKKVFKKYTYQAYKNHYFYQAFQFKVLEKLGVLSKMPWISGGGVSDIVAVPNKLYYDKNINMGIDKNKLKILGDVSYIPLYDIYKDKQKHKKRIIKKYNLEYDKIIIVGLVNWWEHNLADEKTHWDIIFKTIESTLKSCDNEYSILIGLHPSMKLENYLFLEEKYNIRILEERLMNILPIADLYIADESSTVPWAILCGIKTLIINYHMSLNLYPDFTSLVYVTKKDEIIKKLNDMISTNISFSYDWNLLSKDMVFSDHIVHNYIDTFNDMIHNK